MAVTMGWQRGGVGSVRGLPRESKYPAPATPPMAKTRIRFVCPSCGHEAPRWSGQCAGCGEWNTLVEAAAPAPGATRISSAHLGGEMHGGLRATDLVARAGILSTANDLAAAAAVVAPGLTPFRRALARILGRPVGLSGSGPTLWAIYPSEGDAREAAATVEHAIAENRLAAPGAGPPFVAASVIISRDETEDRP